MRPELEDFDELNTGDVSPRSRAMSWLVLAVAVGGFATLAYYAYHSGSQSMRDGTLTVVNAEEGPIKTAPTDAGGEQFPNKDKTIYDAIANDGSAKPHVEKLLPEAEHPVLAPESDEDDTLTPSESPANQAAAAPTMPITAAPVPAAKAPEAREVVKTESPKPEQPKKETPTTYVNAAAKAEGQSDAKSPDSDTPSDAVGTAAAPTMVNLKSATAQTKPTSEAKDDKAAAAKAAKAAKATKEVKKTAKPATGSAKIQLGAFKSQEEAMAQWKKIAAKNSDVLGGAPVIVKADLPNGTFYRLRTNVADAKTTCAKLSARKQACFPAGN